jgi:hypothetical protein
MVQEASMEEKVSKMVFVFSVESKDTSNPNDQSTRSITTQTPKGDQNNSF